jgi:hypothetical protein
MQEGAVHGRRAPARAATPVVLDQAVVVRLLGAVEGGHGPYASAPQE